MVYKPVMRIRRPVKLRKISSSVLLRLFFSTGLWDQSKIMKIFELVKKKSSNVMFPANIVHTHREGLET